MKAIPVTVLFILINSFLHAQKIKKGFEALEELNYFKAKQLFEKTLNSDSTSASYGLSIIYFRNDNPFHSLDSASKYMGIANTSYPKLDIKKREKLNLLKIDANEIEHFKDRIDSALYIRCSQTATVESFEEYIRKYPDSKLIPKAILRRNAVLFEEVKAENTSKAYRAFFKDYPDALQTKEAKNRYEEVLYAEETREGTVASYKKFIENYSNSPYKREAQDVVYRLQTKVQTIQAYDNFIAKNPNNPNLNTAWRHLYKLYIADYSPERIVEFRIDYPNYPFNYEVEKDMQLARKTFLPFMHKSKWGFMDSSGNVMINSSYDFVEPFQEGLALVGLNKRIGFIDKSGKIIIPLEYDDGESFTNGLAIVSKEENYGIIDRANKIIAPLEYELLTQFSNGLALAANSTGYGFLDAKGVAVIPLNLSYATEFKNGFALVEIGGKKGIIDTVGQFVIPINYTWLELFNDEGVCRANNGSGYGLLNNKGEEVCAFVYDKIGTFNSGLAITVKGNKYGYLNTKGELKIPLKYEFTEGAFLWGQFEGAYAKYSRKGKFGIIDSTGVEQTPSIFENIANYKAKGLTQIKKRGKWGYMNASLQLKIPYNYNESLPFLEGKAPVKKDTVWGVINQQGKWEINPKFSTVEILLDSFYKVGINEKLGLLSSNFVELLPTQFNKITWDREQQLLRLFYEEEMYYYRITSHQFVRPNME